MLNNTDHPDAEATLDLFIEMRADYARQFPTGFTGAPHAQSFVAHLPNGHTLSVETEDNDGRGEPQVVMHTYDERGLLVAAEWLTTTLMVSQ